MGKLWEEAEDARADPQPYESDVDNDDDTEDSPRGLERSTEHDMLRDDSSRWKGTSTVVALLAVTGVVLLGGLIPKLPTTAGTSFELGSRWPIRQARSDTWPQTYWCPQAQATGSEMWSVSEHWRH